MEHAGLTERSYRMAEGGGAVLCDIVAAGEELAAVRAALAWHRDRISREAFEDADEALAVAGLVALDDRLLAASASGPRAVLTVGREDALSLCEIVAAYASDRDVESYQPPEERERIGLLRALAGPLMDCCSELAAAEREALGEASPAQAAPDRPATGAPAR